MISQENVSKAALFSLIVSLIVAPIALIVSYTDVYIKVHKAKQLYKEVSRNGTYYYYGLINDSLFHSLNSQTNVSNYEFIIMYDSILFNSKLKYYDKLLYSGREYYIRNIDGSDSVEVYDFNKECWGFVGRISHKKLVCKERLPEDIFNRLDSVYSLRDVPYRAVKNSIYGSQCNSLRLPDFLLK